MSKKFILFFVLLLGLSSSLWADNATFNFTSSGGIDPNVIKATGGASTTWVQNPFTFTFTSVETNNVEVEQSGNNRGLKLQSKAYFSISTSTAFISSIVLTYSDNHFANSSISGGTNDETTHTQTISGSFQNITFTNNTSNNNYIKEIKITYALIEENPVYTGAHEWVFNANRTDASTLTAKNKWVQRGTDGEGNVLLNYNKAVSNEPLYISDTQLLPETKGLTFSSNSVGDIYTNIRYDLSLTNGASVTIPNLKKGQVVTLAAFLWNSEVVSLTNATVKGTTDTSISVTSGANEVTKELIVTADGAVTLQTSNNSEVLCIRSIKTNAGPLTRFSSMGGQPYVHEANGAAFSHTIIVEPHDALPANVNSETLKSYITVTSSYSTAFNVDNISLSYDQSKGRLIINGIQPGATNGTDATLDISYQNRPYDAQTITTRPFYIRQAATVAFPESSKAIRYEDRPEQGQSVTVQTAERIVGDGTIKYKSSSDIVEVNETTGAITAIHGTGAVVITAYTEQTAEYAYAEASYTLNITAEGDVAFYFLRDETKVNIGKSAYLELAMPGVKEDKINELYFIIKDPDGVDHKVYAYGGVTPEDEFSGSVTTEVEKNGDGQIISARIKILADDNVLAVGKSLIVTAYLDYKYTPAGTSDEVEAEASSVTKLTFTGANAKNWGLVRQGGWMFVGDVIAVPGIWGNPNAHEGVEYALATSQQYLKDGVGDETKAVYRPKSNTPTYTLDNPELATLFHCKNLSQLGNDTLLIYARAAGTVKITLRDETLTDRTETYTLRIVNREDPTNNLVRQSADQITKFPYTWDFSQGVSGDSKDLLAADDNYWSRFDHPNNNTTRLLEEGVYTTNIGFARRDVSKDSGNLPHKNFTATNQLLIEFRGIQCQIGGNDMSSTFGRLTIDTNAAVGEPFLHIVGGYPLYLTELDDAYKCVNGDYMIYVKAKKGGKGEIECPVASNENERKQYVTDEDAGQIVSFKVTKGTKNVYLSVDGCYIYWIAATTEARTIGTASGTDGSDANQHLATYSYDADLDLDKVYEAENIDAWYVSSVGFAKPAGATKKQMAVSLSKASDELLRNTGVILRQTDNETNYSTSAYMIAKARNLNDSYSAPGPLYGNMLKATGMTGKTIYAEAGDGEGSTPGTSHLTYIMTSQYVWGKDPNTEINYEGYGFFKLWEDSYAAKPQMSYLVVDKSVFDDVQLGGGVDPADGGAVKLYLVFGDEYEWTSIEDVRTNSKAVEGDEGYYTLQGTRVAQPTKGGIYIHQGKKIFVK